MQLHARLNIPNPKKYEGITCLLENPIQAHQPQPDQHMKKTNFKISPHSFKIKQHIITVS